MQQGYDGDRLRVKKVDNGQTTYYVRSSVLGGQVVGETDSAGNFQRGYVYLGGQLLAMQTGGVRWVHLDPVVKSQRVTDASGALQAVVELDPWGGETSRSWQQGQQPRKFTSYERDGSGNDQAMHRQYHSYWQRFDQPDPYDGSYNLTDPQSLNRYSYVQNDPVNYVDPTGLNPAGPGTGYGGSYWVSWTATGHFVGNTLVGVSDFRYSITPLPGSGGSGDSGASPQNPATPQLPRGTPQDTIDAFNKAFKEALERLEKEKCAKLFGGKDKAIEALSGANYRVLPLGAPKVDRNTGNVSVVGAATYQGSPPSVFINSQGPFLNNRMNIPGAGFKTLDFGTGLRGADFGALLLLHELGHVVGIFKPDAGNDKLNRSYTNQVLKNCF